MPDIEHAEIIGEPGGGDGPPGGSGATDRRADDRSSLLLRVAVATLSLALLLSLVAVAALGVRLRRETSGSPEQRAAVATASAWVRAIDEHDLAGVQLHTDPAARILVVGPDGAVDRPFRGRALTRGGSLSFGDDLSLRILDDPVALQDRQVTMTTTLACEGQAWTHHTVLTLRRDGATLKVASAVFVGATTAGTPAPSG